MDSTPLNDFVNLVVIHYRLLPNFYLYSTHNTLPAYSTLCNICILESENQSILWYRLWRKSDAVENIFLIIKWSRIRIYFTEV